MINCNYLLLITLCGAGLFNNYVNAASNTGLSAPSSPTSVISEIYSNTEQSVSFAPPTFDGGASITSYTMEWDTEPGVPEVQTITTTTNIGPNEIQTITTSALHRDEVQVVRTTSADNVREKQIIRTTAATNNKVGGWFTLVFDTTSTSGTVETSAPIMADAPPKATASTNGHSMQEILEAMQNIGTVNVERTVNPAHTDGFSWTVEFIGIGVNEGNIPQLKLGYSALSGTGADVEIETERDGNIISGTFTLSLDNALTQAIRHDASASVLQQSLEALPNVGVLAVTRTGPDYQGGFAWTVTFMDDMNTGIVPDMVANPEHLNGINSNVTVCTKGANTGNCVGTSQIPTITSINGNEIGGNLIIGCTTCGATVATVPFDVSGSGLKYALESAIGSFIGNVAVSRTTEPDPQKGYTWTVSFIGPKVGDMPDLTVTTGSLTGDTVVANVIETRKGTLRTIQKIVATDVANGTFTMTFGVQTTMAVYAGMNVTSAAQGAHDVKHKLEALSSIGRVETTCVDSIEYPGEHPVRTWTITFETNAGTLPVIVANDVDLTDAPTGTASIVASQVIGGTSSKLSGMYTVEFDGQKTGYLPYDIPAIKLKSALEALTSIGTVDVIRSDVDENFGYVWSITFLTELGNRKNMIVDYKALLGTAPTAKVTNIVQGKPPQFNQGSDGLPLGSKTITDLTSLQHTIQGLKQGVSYFVRVSAMNAIGRSDYSLSTPTGLKPIVLPPTAPTDVGLTVIDGTTLRVGFSSPLRNGGSPVDQYRVEWHTEALVDEIQVVRVLAPVRQHVQVITSSAADQDEVQVIRLEGTGSGADVNEIQTVTCAANQGSFRLLFGGRQSEPIGFDATTSQVQSAILNGLGATVLTSVTVTDPNGQTTICHADTPQPFHIEFVSSPIYSGDMPELISDVTLLGGRKIVTIGTHQAGNAMITGTFALTYEGERTVDISAAATDTEVRDALLALQGIEAGAVTVGRSVSANAAGGYSYSITFTAQSVGGNVPSLVAFGQNLRGNDAKVHVCAGASNVSPCSAASRDGNALRGNFRLELLQHYTSPIPYDASGTTMKSSLEALPNIGTVTVVRGVPTPEDGYTWTVTFTANPGSMPAGSGVVADLIPHFSGTLSGSGANVAVITTTIGSAPLSGTFRLTYDDTGANQKQTDLIRSDAPAAAVKSALELLPNMGRVSVTRLVDTDGFTWKITFNGCKTIGLESEKNICNFEWYSRNKSNCF
jgi:hypothetical protein